MDGQEQGAEAPPPTPGAKAKGLAFQREAEAQGDELDGTV